MGAQIRHFSASCWLTTTSLLINWLPQPSQLNSRIRDQEKLKTSSQQVQTTHQVTDDPTTSEDAYPLFHLPVSCSQPIHVSLSLNAVPMFMEVDTGAALSLISLETFRSLFTQSPPLLHTTQIRLKTYTGEVLKVEGGAQSLRATKTNARTYRLWSWLAADPRCSGETG